MEVTVAREAVIAKLCHMPSNEVLKVLIFMAGLDAGTKLSESAKEKSDQESATSIPKWIIEPEEA